MQKPSGGKIICSMKANVFRRPRTFNLLQRRFCTGADTTAYANVSGRTQLHYAAASGRTRLHMQNRPADIIAYAIMSSGYYCIEDMIACDTGPFPEIFDKHLAPFIFCSWFNPNSKIIRSCDKINQLRKWYDLIIAMSLYH